MPRSDSEGSAQQVQSAGLSKPSMSAYVLRQVFNCMAQEKNLLKKKKRVV